MGSKGRVVNKAVDYSGNSGRSRDGGFCDFGGRNIGGLEEFYKLDKNLSTYNIQLTRRLNPYHCQYLVQDQDNE